MIEGSDEYTAWRQQRLGKATASRIGDVIAQAKNGTFKTSRANYAAELVAERLTGVPYESYQNAAMRWGIETQAEAEAAYCFYRNTSIEHVEGGFINHPQISMSGASPDALVGRVGLLEIKCPNTATHIATLRGAAIDTDYVAQMQWQMACTGRAWCDWVSYDPRMPENMRLFVQRVARNDELIGRLANEVSTFLAEVVATIADLEQRCGAKAA
jgi:predicted phage-related endonuclease